MNQTVIDIPMFDKHHANAELRKKHGEWFWVRMPVSMDSLSRQRLMQTPEGRDAFCVYVHLVEVSAKDMPRGVLADERGPMSEQDIALKTSIPQEVLSRAIDTLKSASIGWVASREWNGNEKPTPLGHSNSSSYSDSSGEEEETCSHFDAFWDAYPKRRRIDRSGCLRHWRRHSLDGIAEQVMAGLGRWKASRQWLKDGGEFVCAPKVFLNRRDWEAEPKPDPARGRRDKADAWDALGAETHRELLAAVIASDPGTHHTRGNTDTERAMRKLARERGLL